MAVVQCQLAVAVDAVGADPDELAELAGQLRARLLDLDLDLDAIYAPSSGEGSEGSKGTAPLQLGSLIVQFLLQQETLRTVIGTMRSWLAHRPGHSVKVTIDGDSLELTGATSEQVDQLVDVWVKRHAGQA